MALNVSKIMYSKAHRLMAIRSSVRDAHSGNKTKGCDKDLYTSGCGSRRIRKEPIRVCQGDPSNPCKSCPYEFPSPCKEVTPEYAQTRIQNAAKYPYKDEVHECCEKGKMKSPRCAEENRVGYKLHIPKTAWQMLHYKAECCPCLPELPRFDELYYKIRKMCEKEYFPTWAECPKPRIVPKVVCCYDKEPIEVPRRIRCKPPQTACPQPEDALNKKLLVCTVGGDPNCVKLFTRCCCPARNPPKCVRIRQPLCDGRLQVPSPAFSECCKGPPNAKRNTECPCLLVWPLCGYPPLPSKISRTC